MKTYFYVKFNTDWDRVGINKYGHTNFCNQRLIGRLYDSHEEHLHQSKYLKIFLIEETENYILDYEKKDDIITNICNNLENILFLEEKIGIKLNNMKDLHKYILNKGGGKEFINKEGLNTLYRTILIDFPKLGLKIEEKDEIFINNINETTNKKIRNDNLAKSNRFQILLNKSMIKPKKLKKIELRDFQQDISINIIEYYRNKNKAILNWICRLGKTIFSIDLFQKMNFKKIIIGVPSIQLMYQWQEKILEYCDYKIVLVGDNNIYNLEEEYHYCEKVIFITTYHSSYKLIDLNFDFKILDEAHHITYENKEEKIDGKFRAVIDIKSRYLLSLTATMKNSDKQNLIGNNNKELFGEIIDSKSLDWAIHKDYICDYEVCTPIFNKEYAENIALQIGNNWPDIKQDLFIDLLVSCLTILEVFKNEANNNTHIINYSNEMKHSKICRDITTKLLEKEEFVVLKDNITNSVILSETTYKQQELILKDYRKTKFGIIHCCYKLGEGFDDYTIDSVCVSENMVSNIRIVQSLLRAHTKDDNRKDKKALILVPVVHNDISQPPEDGTKFKKVLDIIDELANFDKNVEEKVKIVKINKKPEKKPNKDYHKIDEFYSESVKLNIINKKLIRGCTYKKLKKIILAMGQRKDDNLSLQIDYRNKSKEHRLLTIENVDKILKINNKTWFDLYSMDISKYPNYYKFKEEYGKLYDRDKYISLSNSNQDIPPYSDLENLYNNFGYNVNFWYDPIGCEDEF